MKAISNPVPILLLVRELGIGGCERDLTKIAKGIDRSRFQPHVACFHGDGLRTAELQAAGLSILRLPVRALWGASGLLGAYRLARYIKKHNIQVVHAFDVPMDLFAIPVARALRVPVVIASQLGYRWMFERRYQPLLRIIDRVADCVVVNSRAVLQHLIEDEKLPLGRIYLCYNGVEADIFRPLPGPRPRPLHGASLVIGSVCALRAEKRLDLLLDAFAKVRHLLPGMKLLIVGSGPMLPDLQAQQRRLGLLEDCIFEPATPEVADWMRAIDVFVLPSSSESFPNSPLEAMACGCCVVASRVGGLPELISDQQDGLLFDSGRAEDLVEKLALVIRNKPLREDLARAAVQTAHHSFPMRRTLERTQALYESLLLTGVLPEDHATQSKEYVSIRELTTR